jgi:hypothetical protein
MPNLLYWETNSNNFKRMSEYDIDALILISILLKHLLLINFYFTLSNRIKII